MKVVIVGGGVVGQATGRGLTRYGHHICYIDQVSSPDLSLEWYTWKNIAKGQGDPLKADFLFLCVPEAAIPGVTDELNAALALANLGWPTVVIRSTVPPGTTRNMGTMAHVNHNPEFLREAVAGYEFLNPPGIVVGVHCEECKERLRKLYEPMRCPLHFTTPEVSEMAKIAVNGHLACLISYWNAISLLCEQLEINSHEIGALASYCDDRVSPYGARMHGAAYGGKCLPKEVTQLISLSDQRGVIASEAFFQAIEGINDYIRLMGRDPS